MSPSRLLPLLLTAFLGRASPAALPQSGCSGCTGTGGAASASGGTCGGFVSISVTVLNGKCKIFQTWDPPIIACHQFRPCIPQVTRSWSGLPAGTDLDFCVTIGNDTLCLEPPPVVGGSGSGSDSRDSAEIGCSNNPGNTRSFSVESAACGLSASVSATCSGCQG